MVWRKILWHIVALPGFPLSFFCFSQNLSLAYPLNELDLAQVPESSRKSNTLENQIN